MQALIKDNKVMVEFDLKDVDEDTFGSIFKGVYCRRSKGW